MQHAYAQTIHADHACVLCVGMRMHVKTSFQAEKYVNHSYTTSASPPLLSMRHANLCAHNHIFGAKSHAIMFSSLVFERAEIEFERLLSAC